MTQPDAAVPDFTIPRPPHQFTIDSDLFLAPGFLAPFTLKKLAREVGLLGDLNNLSGDVEAVVKAIDAAGAVMATLMPGPSGQLFRARLFSEGGPDDPLPIDLMKQAIPALYYLLECYGLRPTVPSSPSSDGSTDGQTSTPSEATSSTAGVSPVALTSEG
jgi:hypothetical protein